MLCARRRLIVAGQTCTQGVRVQGVRAQLRSTALAGTPKFCQPQNLQMHRGVRAAAQQPADQRGGRVPAHGLPVGELRRQDRAGPVLAPVHGLDVAAAAGGGRAVLLITRVVAIRARELGWRCRRAALWHCRGLVGQRLPRDHGLCAARSALFFRTSASRQAFLEKPVLTS